jgi:ubiquinone/menaquinone biosynthesis C-methylase UbiE
MVQFPGPPIVPVFPDPVKNKPVFGPQKSPNQPNVFPGMQVLIAGLPKSEFVLKAAQRTGPQGHVFVVAEPRGASERLQASMQPFGFDNLTFQTSENYELSLPEASIDRAYLVSALDKITDKLRVLKNLRQVFKPEGLLGVDQRLLELGLSGRKTVLQWCQKSGFELAASYGNPLHYFLVFRPEESGSE